MPSQGELDQRVARLEKMLDTAIERAREHPIGRKILVILGLS